MLMCEHEDKPGMQCGVEVRLQGPVSLGGDYPAEDGGLVRITWIAGIPRVTSAYCKDHLPLSYTDPEEDARQRRAWENEQWEAEKMRRDARNKPRSDFEK